MREREREKAGGCLSTSAAYLGAYVSTHKFAARLLDVGLLTAFAAAARGAKAVI